MVPAAWLGQRIKWEHGETSSTRNRGCPRNCERIANRKYATGRKAGKVPRRDHPQARRPVIIRSTQPAGVCRGDDDGCDCLFRYRRAHRIVLPAPPIRGDRACSIASTPLAASQDPRHAARHPHRADRRGGLRGADASSRNKLRASWQCNATRRKSCCTPCLSPLWNRHEHDFAPEQLVAGQLTAAS